MAHLKKEVVGGGRVYYHMGVGPSSASDTTRIDHLAFMGLSKIEGYQMARRMPG